MILGGAKKGGAKKEKLQGVCSLYRRDAYPNTGTNSRDGDLTAQGNVGTEAVWAQPGIAHCFTC